jgi:hypothetical protein
MKRNTITIQINFNNIIIYQDNEYKKYFLKHSINNYKIYNKEIFIEDFKNIIDKLKINNKLLTDNINIIIDSSYKEDDQILLKETFKELSFNKIKLVNNLTLINNQDNEIIINICNKNIKIYHNNNVLDINVYFNKHIETLSTYIKEMIKQYKIKTIKVYGDYKELNKMIYKVERKVRKEVYVYTNPELIPICYFVE